MTNDDDVLKPDEVAALTAWQDEPQLQRDDAPAELKKLHVFGQSLSWQQAQELMGMNMLVRRTVWPASMFLYYTPEVTFDPQHMEMLKKHYIPGGKLTMRGFIAKCEGDGKHNVWYPTAEDIDTPDWLFVGSLGNS